MKKRRDTIDRTLEQLRTELRAASSGELLQLLGLRLLGHLGFTRWIGEQYRRLEKMHPTAVSGDE